MAERVISLVLSIAFAIFVWWCMYTVVTAAYQIKHGTVVCTSSQ